MVFGQELTKCTGTLYSYVSMEIWYEIEVKNISFGYHYCVPAGRLHTAKEGELLLLFT